MYVSSSPYTALLKRQLSIVSLFSICYSKYILTRELTFENVCLLGALTPLHKMAMKHRKFRLAQVGMENIEG